MANLQHQLHTWRRVCYCRHQLVGKGRIASFGSSLLFWKLNLVNRLHKKQSWNTTSLSCPGMFGNISAFVKLYIMLGLLYLYLCIPHDNWLKVKRLCVVRPKFHIYIYVCMPNKAYLLWVVFYHVWQQWIPARHRVYFSLVLMFFNLNTATDCRIYLPQ